VQDSTSQAAQQAPSPRKHHISVFRDVRARSIQRVEQTWPQIVKQLSSETRRRKSKSDLPLFSMARFGDQRTAAGCYRYDANLISISGLLGDHDAGTVSPLQAAEMLNRANMLGIVYTTPSHSNARPRWRAALPLAEDHPPADHQQLMGVANAILGGSLAAESFDAGRSYYFGPVDGVEFLALVSDGFFYLDWLENPPLPIFPKGKPAHAHNGEDRDRILAKLEERGLVLRALGNGKHALRCPWESEHTTPVKDGDTSTVYVQAHFDGRIHDGFKCLHGHCTHRGLKDLLDFLEPPVEIFAGGRKITYGGTGTTNGQVGHEGTTGHTDQTDSAAPLEDIEPKWPEPLAAEAFYGLAGEFVRMVEPHSEADPAALLVQFLVAFGHLVGRAAGGPFHPVEGDRHYAHLFALIVGATSSSRKGTSWGRVRRIFELVPEWVPPVSGLSTGEGLKFHVRDARYKKDKDGVEVCVDEGVEDKRLLALSVEFAGVLAVAERHESTLSTTIREGWDTGSLRTLTKNDPVVATGAHISIIGHITLEELRRRLTDLMVANGLLNRFLVVAAKRSKALPHGGGDLALKDLMLLADQVYKRAEAARTFTQVDLAPAARPIWEAAYDELTADRRGLYGAATARGAPLAKRLAMIYALLDGRQAIGAEHLTAALALWRYCDASVAYIFGEALGDPLADQILAMLRQAGEKGMTRTEISNALGRNAKADKLDAALDILSRQGKVSGEQESTGGRPTRRWRATKKTK